MILCLSFSYQICCRIREKDFRAPWLCIGGKMWISYSTCDGLPYILELLIPLRVANLFSCSKILSYFPLASCDWHAHTFETIPYIYINWYYRIFSDQFNIVHCWSSELFGAGYCSARSVCVCGVTSLCLYCSVNELHARILGPGGLHFAKVSWVLNIRSGCGVILRSARGAYLGRLAISGAICPATLMRLCSRVDMWEVKTRQHIDPPMCANPT